MSSKRIGWVGLGNMGSRMAPRLVSAGWKVAGFDTNPERVIAATRHGVLPATDLATLARESDILVSMIPSDTIFLAIVRTAADLMARGACLIDMSTLSPSASAEAALTWRRTNADRRGSPGAPALRNKAL